MDENTAIRAKSMHSTQSHGLIHQMFEQQSLQTPDAIAVTFEDQQLTYQELNQKANQVAHYLQSLGVKPETLVGVCIERSLEMLIALLGVLKAGGAYVPLDPSYPTDRLAFMVEDAQLPILLTEQAQLAKLPQTSAHVVVIETDRVEIDRQSVASLTSEVNPDNVAYTIYTSGSTGKPKGVQVLHGAVVNFLASMRQSPGLTRADTLLAVTTISFDIAVLELFLPLSVGAKIVLVSREVAADGVRLAQVIAESGTTFMQATPATWRLLLEIGWRGDAQLKLLCGGEAMTRNLADRLLERCGSLWNMYGPTETTVWSAVFQVEPGIAAISIGYPIANTQIYFIDQQCQRKDDLLRQVEIGQPGELHIGGDGLARGYLNRAEMTATKFIPDPFSTKPGARLYKTGDLARLSPDGSIQYIGRIDNQVKIRGYRIELGDIEAAIGQHPNVAEAAVIVREDKVGEKRLVAYLKPQSELAISTAGSNPDSVAVPVENLAATNKWQEVWSTAYRHGEAIQDPTFNINGWTCSYTGALTPEDELHEWVDHTVDRILDLQPRKLLEIGCGTGLLLFRVAPHCDRYLGTDISTEAIKYIGNVIEQSDLDLGRVSLLQTAADAIKTAGADRFDTVVINSVIQYFPSIDYLVQILENAVDLVAPGGRIFIGDVRSLQLLAAFHSSIQLYQAADNLSVSQLQQRIQARISQDKELVIDPAFFTALKQHLPRISHVEIQLKRGAHHSELTKFRYDVVLHIEAEISTPDAPVWLDWHRQGLSGTKLVQLLSAPQPEFLGITNIPNARLSQDLAAISLLNSDNDTSTISALKAALLEFPQPIGIDPELLWQLGRELAYEVEINWSEGSVNGTYNVAFYQRSTVGLPQIVTFPTAISGSQNTMLQPWSAYSNQPFVANIGSELIPQLRVFLQEKLPEYMVPSTFVLMETMPLTPNGKIDRRALPAPSSERPTLDELFVAPRNAIEQQIAKIWSQTLAVNSIGVNDNFFDLGGHSLFVAKMMTQVADVFDIVLPLSCLFKSPTIAGLAQSIAHQSGDEGELNQPDLLADTILSASIFPENLEIDGSSLPQHILLTGATGFLGAFLVDELLQSTQANIYCLVRYASLEIGREKIQQNLAKYGLKAAAQSSRVIPLLGDLSQPLLGLSELQFHKLAGQIDLIYHNGAFVNLIYPYAALRDVNVLGTQEILRLASQVKVKPVHYVSTLDVFQSDRYAQMDLLMEQDDFADFAGPTGGYAQSKWVGEKLVMAAHKRGIPTTIYRLGMISGDSRTGVAKTEDLVCRFIKGAIQLETAPKIALEMHLTPVDYTTKAIVQLSLQQSSWGQAFHLTNSHPLSIDRLVEHIRSLGYPLHQVEHDRWQAVLLGEKMNSINALSPLVSLFTADNSAHANYLEVLTMDKVSCQNTIAGLVGTGISCPALDTELLNTYFTYLIESGFLDRAASTSWHRPAQPQFPLLDQLLKAPLPQSATEALMMN
jgi:amino acid adenylation domain-containing protein/thioester reductase-like protein